MAQQQQSLRTRRPTLPGANPRPIKISEPQARPRPRDPNQPASSLAAKRDARKSRVDDKIKKRMSMRYADNVDFSAVGAGEIPSMPNFPGGSGAGRTRDEVRDDPRAVDVEVMQKEGFDPDACELGLLCRCSGYWADR